MKLGERQCTYCHNGGDTMKCSICNKDIKPVGTWTEGNNAQPINDGRCCDGCKKIAAAIDNGAEGYWTCKCGKEWEWGT